MTSPTSRSTPRPPQLSSDSIKQDPVRVDELQARLREAEETLDAIRNGDVDAVVVGGPSGQQVYTLENADRPYRVLIEQMQEGAVTLSGDGTVLYCNQRFALIVGRSRETIVGHSVTRFFHAEEIELFRHLLARGPGAGASGEFTLHATAVAKVPVNISLVDLKVDDGMPRVVCCVVTDLSHNRMRAHELAAANERLGQEIEERRRTEDSLQLTLEAAGMASWDLDIASDILRRSLRHDQIFGHTQLRSAWSLKTTLEQFLPEDRESVAKAFAEAQTSGAIELERRIQRSGDGAIRWLHIKGRTYYDGGAPTRIAGVVADVTERREFDEQLRQAQKMEAVGQLTGGIAHDFNNLLTIIVGNLETMQRWFDTSPVDPDRAKRLVENAMAGAQRAAALTQRLLAFSRRQPLDPKPVDSNKLVGGMSDLLQRTLGEQVTVELLLAADLWRTHADPNQLESAILNLAINARDAMPGGGKLTIETTNTTFDEGYPGRDSDTLAGQYVQIDISDTGVGMTKEVLAQAFLPFFTTKDSGHGTGLGLSQVYGFVKQSGGHATIYSEPGLGTTVKVYLPRFRGEELEPEIGTLAEAIPMGDRSETILVVDDEEEVRRHSASLLTELGYRVLEAVDGHTALDVLRRHSEISLLFTDVGLPGGMNGRQLADEAQRRIPLLKVLFTSGYAKAAIVHDGRLDAGVQLVTKPFTYAVLAQRIREALDKDNGAPCILVVEDEKLVRLLAVDTLSELGCRVEEAGSAKEAIDKLRTARTAISAAVIDIGLPDQRGDTLALALRDINATLPIVIASGNMDEGAWGRLRSHPAIGFLGKPYASRQLVSALQELGVRLSGGDSA